MNESLDFSQDLIVRIAWLHYIEGYTQTEIADMFELSRPKVTRLLERAREDGIVKFVIEAPHANCLSIEKELKQTFPTLQDAVVVPTGRDEEGNILNIGKGGAFYLARKIKSGDLIGISWGRTLKALAEAIRPEGKIEEVRFVSLAGGLTTSSFMNPYNIGEKLATIFQGQCYYIHAPEVVETAELKKFYLNERVNKKTYEMARRAHWSAIGIGTVDIERSTYILAGFITPQDMEIIRQMGGVGDILGQYFDQEGKILDLDLHQRTIAIPLNELKDMPNVLAVAGGRHKVDAILGAIRGGFIKILVTDEDTARKVLEKAR